MTITARRMNMGARSIITGHQIIGQLHGPATHVGPNALLRTTSYPAPTVSPGTGPLLIPAVGSNNTWRVNSNDEFQTIGAPDNDPNGGLALNWASGANTTYVYNNNLGNHGGTCPTNMVIDGFPVVAGTEVFQFMDLSAGEIYLDSPGGGVPAGALFRGCRFRKYQDPSSDGFIHATNAYTTPLYIFYCEFGGIGNSITNQYSSDSLNSLATTSLIVYRNYFSLHGTAIQPNGSSPASGEGCDIMENYMENWIYNPGNNPPATSDHDNGISASGNGWTCFRWQRNYIVAAAVDANGREIQETDCISIGSDGGVNNTGTGTNPDGSVGFQITHNYCAGTGYCYYLSYTGSNTVTGVNFANNLVSTSSWPIGSGGTPFLGGGYAGPYTDAPAWTGTNTKSNNLWADGASARTLFI